MIHREPDWGAIRRANEKVAAAEQRIMRESLDTNAKLDRMVELLEQILASIHELAGMVERRS